MRWRKKASATCATSPAIPLIRRIPADRSILSYTSLMPQQMTASGSSFFTISNRSDREQKSKESSRLWTSTPLSASMINRRVQVSSTGDTLLWNMGMAIRIMSHHQKEPVSTRSTKGIFYAIRTNFPRITGKQNPGTHVDLRDLARIPRILSGTRRLKPARMCIPSRPGSTTIR